MPVIEKALPCLVLAVGAGAWFMQIGTCHSQWNVHRARAVALEGAIEAYAQDTGHLPPSLGDLLLWHELGWQGPYRRAGELLDIDGTAFSYEIVDDCRQAFRLSLPARTASDPTTVWPALIEENEGIRDTFQRAFPHSLGITGASPARERRGRAALPRDSSRTSRASDEAFDKPRVVRADRISHTRSRRPIARTESLPAYPLG